MLGVLIGLIVIILIIWLIRIPIIIAQKRGISEKNITTIAILSWVGILIGITWVIALVLSLIWQPDEWIGEKQPEQEKAVDYSQLEKLYQLKQKGIISEAEYEKEKSKILK